MQNRVAKILRLKAVEKLTWSMYRDVSPRSIYTMYKRVYYRLSNILRNEFLKSSSISESLYFTPHIKDGNISISFPHEVKMHKSRQKLLHHYERQKQHTKKRNEKRIASEFQDT